MLPAANILLRDFIYYLFQMQTKKLLAKAVATGATVLLSATLFTGMAGAVSVTPTARSGARLEQACQRITSVIDQRITAYDNHKEDHVQRYNNIVNRVTALVSKLTDKGYDVSKLTTDLQTLNGMIKDFATDYTNFINTLKDAKQFACGNSQGQFAVKVEEARGFLKQAREQAVAIRSFILETIKPDLQALKDQKPANNTAQ
jgi:hypothetical protein